MRASCSLIHALRWPAQSRQKHTRHTSSPTRFLSGGLQRWLAQTTQGTGGWGFLTVLLVLLVAPGLWRWTRHHTSAPPGAAGQQSETVTESRTQADHA